MSNAKQGAIVPQENTSVVSTADNMIQLAIDQNADVDKLERLIAMKERWDANEARKQYVQAIAKFADECPSIVKTKKGHNSSYAPLPDILKAIKPAMKECGLSHAWNTNRPEGVAPDSAAICVTCVITHVGGHSESTMLVSGAETSGSKNAIQAIGSAITYLQRYTLMSALGLSAGDDDDGESADNMTLDDVVSLMEKAKNLAELDARAKHASQLTGKDKDAARDAYKLRKEELSQ